MNDISEFEIVLRLENMPDYCLGLFIRQDTSSVNYFLKITVAVLKKQVVQMVICVRDMTVELCNVARLYLLEQI